MKKLLYVLSLGLFLVSCKEEEEVVVNAPIQTGNMPVENPVTSTLKLGTFTSYQHSLAGTATIVRDTTRNVLLRLEDYTMTAGPDVHVYLSKTSSYSPANVIEVKHLTDGYSKYDLTIDVQDDTDFGTYKYVLVWCVKFNSLFGYAELKDK